jgi:hypothetical protein
MSSWITLAKKHGAIFQNIDIVYKNESFSIETIEENREFNLSVPSTFLINIEDIIITDSEHYIKDDVLMDTDIKTMFNEYFDFIFSVQRLKILQSFLSEFVALPLELKNELICFNFSNLFKLNSNKELKNKLIHNRVITYNNRIVFMPFLDFTNHNFYDSYLFQSQKDAICIKGIATKNKEVFTMYNRMLDSFGYLQTYMFIPQALNALSIDFTISNSPNLQITIERNDNSLTEVNDNLMLPHCHQEEGKIILKALWIGSLHRPLKPYQSFKKLWEEKLHRTDTQGAYSIIKGLNIKKLTAILRLCYKTKNSIAVEMIQECALQQLLLISGSFEIIQD